MVRNSQGDVLLQILKDSFKANYGSFCETKEVVVPLARFEQSPELGDLIGLTQDHENIVSRESDVSAGIGQYFGAPSNGRPGAITGRKSSPRRVFTRGIPPPSLGCVIPSTSNVKRGAGESIDPEKRHYWNVIEICLEQPSPTAQDSRPVVLFLSFATWSTHRLGL